MPRVSVCIRTLDRPRALQDAIASVLAQSFADFEIVVSDDSGRLGEVVTAYADPRVRYCANPHPDGPTANLTHAMALTRGDLLALLDDDDRWLPTFLESTVGCFDEDPDLGLVFTDQYWVSGGRQIRRPAALEAGRHDAMLCAVLQHPFPPSAALMRRETWEQGERERPLRPSLAGGATLMLRIAEAGWPFYRVDEPLVEYRLHREQMSWSGDIAASRYAAALECFRFADAEAERLRRARLVEAHLAQAGMQLRRGHLGAAAHLLRRARMDSPQPLSIRGCLALLGVKPAAARYLATHPRLLAAGLPAWHRLRPAVR